MSDKSYKPKRPMSSFILFLNSAREQIKADHPGIKVTDVVKKGGEMWRAMTDKSVWEKKAAKAKEQYRKDLKSFNTNCGAGEGPGCGKAKIQCCTCRVPASKKNEESDYEDYEEDESQSD